MDSPRCPSLLTTFSSLRQNATESSTLPPPQSTQAHVFSLLYQCFSQAVPAELHQTRYEVMEWRIRPEIIISGHKQTDTPSGK